MTTERLSQPLPLARGGALPNRLAKAAMSEQLGTPEHSISPELIRAYERWSEGGAGLLITGNVMVDPDAIAEPGNVVSRPQDLPLWKDWARAAQQNGTRSWVQLNHPGRQSPKNLSKTPVAPSAVAMKGLGPAFAPPRALEGEEIKQIISRFAEAATLAEKAGFAGVQIHGAHGYLINQFLSPLANLRDDAWGGSLDNRMRFLLEVVRAVRGATSEGFAVGLKLNSADFQRGGFTEDESMNVVRALNGEKIDLLEISGGTYEKAAMWGDSEPKAASTRAREGYFLQYAEKVRTIAKMPLMVTGGFRTAEGMAAALATGAVDLVGLARPLAAEPDLPRRLLSGEAAAAVPVRLQTGFKQADSLLESAWYQKQIRRLGEGEPLNPRAGRLWAAGKAIANALSMTVNLNLACPLRSSRTATSP